MNRIERRPLLLTTSWRDLGGQLRSALRRIALFCACAGACACASASTSASNQQRYGASKRVNAPNTLGAPGEGMPDPDLAKRGNADDLEAFGATPPESRQAESRPAGWLGVELQASRGGEAGVRVVDVVKRSPAATAGIVAGDSIVQIDGEVVSDPVSVVKRIRKTHAGAKLSIGYQRQGALRLAAITVEAAPSPDELIERRFVGRPAPPLDGLTMVEGDVAANWSALRGSLVILEFWAPWCGVCRVMHERLNEWQTQWAMYGLRVIGITASSPEEARSFAQRLGMGYAIAVDTDELVFRSYDVFSIPSVFLVDRRGTVADATTGYSTKRLANMEKKLIALIGTESP